jgi:hypothetical protein
MIIILSKGINISIKHQQQRIRMIIQITISSDLRFFIALISREFQAFLD